MKKLLTLLLLAALCCAALPARAERKERVSGAFVYVLLEDGTAEITLYGGEKNENLVLPDELGGRPVTSVAPGIFRPDGKSKDFRVRSLQLPGTLIRIRSGAFAGLRIADGCLTVPEGVETLEEDALRDISGLKKVVLPGTLKTVGAGVFGGDRDLKEISFSSACPDFEVAGGALLGKADHRLICYPAKLPWKRYEIPEGTRLIDREAVSCCALLQELVIPEGAELAYHSVSDNSKLRLLSLPRTCAVWDPDAVCGCPALREIVIPEDHPAMTLLNGMLVERETLKLLRYPPAKKEREAVLPEGITEIGAGAFEDAMIESVLIPATVTRIGERAFSGARLRRITVPEGVTELGPGALSDCGQLTKAALPRSLVSLESPFAGSGKLREVVVPADHAHLKYIGDLLVQTDDMRTVWYPPKLRKECCTVPDGIRAIGDGTFRFGKGERQYLTRIVVPEGVTEIGDLWVANNKVDLTVELPASLEEIGDHAFDACGELRSLFLSVPAGSYAEQYCRSHSLRYTPR